MKKEELDRLLDKYYKGESTEKEEKVLIDFFNGVDVPEGYEAEKAVFSYYSSSRDMHEPSADFEAGILSRIDEIEKLNRSARTRNLAMLIMSAAAGLLIMAGSYFFFTNRNEMHDTFTDPEIAYAETMKILLNVSSRLNNGTKALGPVGIINEVKSKNIDKNLKNLEYIEAAIDLTRVSIDKK
jgi:hypothetical protein